MPVVIVRAGEQFGNPFLALFCAARGKWQGFGRGPIQKTSTANLCQRITDSVSLSLRLQRFPPQISTATHRWNIYAICLLSSYAFSLRWCARAMFGLVVSLGEDQATLCEMKWRCTRARLWRRHQTRTNCMLFGFFFVCVEKEEQWCLFKCVGHSTAVKFIQICESK